MKNKGFTLVELIAVLIILAIISLIVAPLILNTVRRVKNDTNKRSIDGYGRAAQYAISNYELKQLPYPDSFDELEIDYHGNKVECETSRINPDHTIYLSKCKVNGKLVKDDKNKDGYYHFGILKMTNQEYVDTYGKNLEDALKKYYDEHNEYPEDYTTLALKELDKEVACDVDVNIDGTVYLTNCSVNDEYVMDDTSDDGYYQYGEILTAVKYLLSRTNSKDVINYTEGNTHEMYTFDHEATEQTPALTDYRYIGNEPYNYVKFNGEELWRIIGVFKVEDENGNLDERVKIVRNTKLDSDMAWDSSNVNEWKNATLNTYLNVNYYNELSEISQSMIATSKYYLGGIISSNVNAETFYSGERGTTVYNGRSIMWNGKIALMYPSDYLYIYSLGIDDVCYNYGYQCAIRKNGKPANGWIHNTNSNSYQWLLSPRSDADYLVFFIYNSGNLHNSSYNLRNLFGVRPVAYLKPNVKIKSGDGSIDNPYEFEL